MKNRLKVFLLAAGLTVSMLGTTAAFAEDATETVQEQAVEAETAVQAGEDAAEGGVYAMYYDQMMSYLPTTLEQLSAMTDAQLESLIENNDGSGTSVIAANWAGVKEELGTFVSCDDTAISEDGDQITVTGYANYDGVDEKTKVFVTYVMDLKNQTASMSWDITYPMSKLISQAGMNTLIGIMIVFLVLLFLSFLISQMHWIPDLVNGRKKKEQEAAKAAAPAPAPAAPVVEEEELVDDGELIAVIAAAIAASEQTSVDGFVVRSIRKANRKNWQNA